CEMRNAELQGRLLEPFDPPLTFRIPHSEFRITFAHITALLAIDQGTTGSTALVVAADGRVLGRGYREIPQYFPAPGQVEHDAEEILAATVTAAREALAQAKVVPAALGITNQRETVCAWERDTGRAVHRALVWQDRRTAPRCQELARDRQAKLVRERTGLVLDPYFSATKIEWLLQHVPGLAARVRAGEVVFGTMDTWLLFRLTGGKAYLTDHPTPRVPCSTTSKHARGTKTCCGSSGCRGPRYRTSARRAACSGRARRGTWAPSCRSAASQATSRRPYSARDARSQGRRRTRMALAPSCSSTPATAGPCRSTGCSRRSRAGRGASRCTRSRAASSSLGPRSSGCATGSS